MSRTKSLDDELAREAPDEATSFNKGSFKQKHDDRNKSLLADSRAVDIFSPCDILIRKCTARPKNCHAGTNTVSSVHAQPKTRSHENFDMLFQLQNVTKTYGAITALDDLSVTVPTGAIGLLGPNGSGKTTMIRTLLGLISIDRGTGEILGMDFRRRQLDIRQAVGFAPEDECLFPAWWASNSSPMPASWLEWPRRWSAAGP